MKKLLLLAMLAAAAWAQDDNTLTVTASRPRSVQPDQVLISVTVTAPATAGPDDVLAAITGSGATLSDLTPGYAQNQVELEDPFITAGSSWPFLIPTSFDGLKTVLTALAADQQTAQQKNTGFDISFSVAGTQISSALQAAQSCPYTSLFGDAQSQGTAVASAAGMGLGEVVGLSDGSDIQQPAAAERNGDFAANYLLLGEVSFVYTSPVAMLPCTLVVQFRLTAQ